MSNDQRFRSESEREGQPAMVPAERRHDPPVASASPALQAALHRRMVQRRAASRAPSNEAAEQSTAPIHEAAAAGTSGPSQPLPHGERIQAAFGDHDVSQIQAFVGGPAQAAAERMGAVAYASGSRVAFAETPDLHTAAHEAAHVVQQRAGVQLKGGVGEANDVYERHANAVADAVVSGASAAPLLDEVAPVNRGSAGGAVAAQASGIQRLATPSVYKTVADLQAMMLGAFDTYAREQADWATGPALADPDKSRLRSLLELARKDNLLILGGCDNLSVKDLVAKGVGSGGPIDAQLQVYSKAVKHAGTTVEIEEIAKTVDEAASWGEALTKLEKTPGRVVIHQIIKQDNKRQNLRDLAKSGMVDDFIRYVTACHPILHASNGAEIRSYLALRGEGGDPVSYKSTIKTVVNYHRFEKAALDGLVNNQSAPKGNLPLTIILHSSYDHNGAFHRDSNLTQIITRPNNVTLMIEGKATLADFSSQLEPLAKKYKSNGKVDQVMIAGHGNAQFMELAGGVKQGKDRDGNDAIVEDKPEYVSPKYQPGTTDPFFDDIIQVMASSPDARIVFNACLTNSNVVDKSLLDPDPAKAQNQIRQAIHNDPSLATALRDKAKAKGLAVDVRGANASFGQIGLLDTSGKIDLISAGDPKLTTPNKQEYAEFGTEPLGALRAAVESWGDNPTACLDALKRRVAAKASDTSWEEVVIRTLYQVILAHPNDGQLMNQLAFSAGALAELVHREECTVAKLKGGKVPAAHLDTILGGLKASVVWSAASFAFLPTVVYQVWMEKTPARTADFLAHLAASPGLNTQTVASFIDLALVTPLLPGLLSLPPATPVDRGRLLLALVYLVKQGSAAPAPCKEFLKAVIGMGNTRFPASAPLGSVLKGRSEQEVLEALGVVPKATGSGGSGSGSGSGATAPVPNVDLAHGGTNDFYVEPLTQRGRLGSQKDVLAEPTGKTVATLAAGTVVHILGKAASGSGSAAVSWYAIEHGGGAAFIQASGVQIL